MPKFRVEVLATRVLEIDISESFGGSDWKQDAELLAIECLFDNPYPNMVRVHKDWDAVVKTVTSIEG